MSDFTFTIQAPELAAAIAALATAMGGAKIAPTAQLVPTHSPIAPTPTPVAPTIALLPATPPITAPTTAAPTYSIDQIMTAGAALMDAGKINELMGLLNTFGVPAVNQLKPEHLGAFATEMRKLGAQI